MGCTTLRRLESLYSIMQNTEFLTAFSAVYEAYIHTVYPFMAQRKADFVCQCD